MAKDKKKKKQKSAPDQKENRTENRETEVTEQMAREAESTDEELKQEDMREETAGETVQEDASAETDTAAAAENEDPEEKSGSDDAAAEKAGDDAPEDAGENVPDGEEAKGFFKKKKKEKKDKKDEKIAELTDKLQRQMAEFENFRRRTEKEKSTMYDMGTRDTVEKLLPVVDNFERGLAGAPEEDPFAEGMRMIYKQLMTMLDGIGVTPIDAAGKAFDPNLHNAVMHVDDDSFGENIVAEELQKGYMYKDHVVRHSMVKVAN